MISDESFDILISRLKKFKPMYESFLIQLHPLLHEISQKRGELILLEGVVPNLVYFVISGSAREISIHPLTGERETSWMWFPDDFIFTNPGFFSEEPAECSIEAMEDVVLVCIERKDFAEFKGAFPLAHKLAEMIRDYYLKLLKKYAFDLTVLSNQERFDKFIAAHPKAMATLVHQHIASFLGIRDKGLGRYSHRK